MRTLDFTCTISQGFGQNSTSMYKESGFAGHTGIDEICGYGSEIRSYVDGIVFDIATPSSPDNDGYTRINMIVETPLEVFEWLVGHVSRIDVKRGEHVATGQIIGLEGNKGPVASGGERITLGMQARGDKRGTHRHIQKRPVVKVRSLNPRRQYLLSAGQFFRDANGFYYEPYMFDNGYKGCVDPSGPLFKRDMHVGSSGYDVYLLQKALVAEGLFTPENCIGSFGPKTLAAATALQRKYAITPTYGYVGPKTRFLLNTKYFQV